MRTSVRRHAKIKPLSFTQISLYQTCPWQYKLQYIDKLKTKDKWYFSFGTTMHRCVEYFFKVAAPPPPSLNELYHYYYTHWLSAGYESPEEEARYKEYGKQILADFWKIHGEDFRLPVALEKRFSLNIGGYNMVGFIDRVDKLDSGGLSVLDYKTNKDLFTTEYVENDLQLTFYQLAAQELWQLPVEKLTLYHLRTNTPISCPPRGQARLDEARQLVTDVAESIQRGEFPATENQFCPCDFPEHCPYYKHQYLVSEPPAQQSLLSAANAAEAVERYAALQAQMKELEMELAEAKEQLSEYCLAEGLNRVYGSQYDITYRLVERTGYGEAEVRELLEPAGLWERALKFDPTAIKALLADRCVAEEIRGKLEKLRCITSTYPQLFVRKHEETEE